MNLSDNFIKLTFSLLAVISFGLSLNNFLVVGNAQNFLILFGLACALLSYRFSNNFKLRNSIEKLIKQQGEKVEISSIKLLPFNYKLRKTTLEIQRISKVTVGDDWLSIIIDGNGNGYDFQLSGSKSQIDEHMKALLGERQSTVNFHYL